MNKNRQANNYIIKRKCSSAKCSVSVYQAMHIMYSCCLTACGKKLFLRWGTVQRSTVPLPLPLPLSLPPHTASVRGSFSASRSACSCMRCQYVNSPHSDSLDNRNPLCGADDNCIYFFKCFVSPAICHEQMPPRAAACFARA